LLCQAVKSLANHEVHDSELEFHSHACRTGIHWLRTSTSTSTM